MHKLRKIERRANTATSSLISNVSAFKVKTLSLTHFVPRNGPVSGMFGRSRTLTRFSLLRQRESWRAKESHRSAEYFVNFLPRLTCLPRSHLMRSRCLRLLTRERGTDASVSFRFPRLRWPSAKPASPVLLSRRMFDVRRQTSKVRARSLIFLLVACVCTY